MLFPFACVCDVSNNSRSHRINIWMKELRDVTSRGAKSFLSCLPFESNVCSFKHRPQMAFRRKWKSNGSLFACSKKEDGVEDWTNRKKQESMHVSIPTKLFFFKGESSFFSFLLNFCSDVWLWRINSRSWMWTMRNDYFFALYRHAAWKIRFKANRTFKFPEKGLKNIDRVSWFEEIETKSSVIMQRNFLFNSFMRVMI